MVDAPLGSRGSLSGGRTPFPLVGATSIKVDASRPLVCEEVKASPDQASSHKDVSADIGTLDQVIQRTAAMVRVSSAVSRLPSQEAAQHFEWVDFFDLGSPSRAEPHRKRRLSRYGKALLRRLVARGNV